MDRHDKVKVNRANAQTGGKNRSTTSVLAAFSSSGLFNIFPYFEPIAIIVLCLFGGSFLTFSQVKIPH
jgi:hypothetical protein